MNVERVGEVLRRVGLYLLVGAVSSCCAWAQSQPDVLTLDQALATAASQNRLVRNASLEADKVRDRIRTTRSRRLPEFQLSALQTEMLKSVDFTFRKGVFGSFPGIGPVPSVDTVISNAATPSTFVLGSINQPLTQQYRIGLGIKAQELGREIALESLRLQKQKVLNEVRTAYYALSATQAGLRAVRQSVDTLREADRVTLQYLSQESVLKADSLDVKVRLAKQEHQLVVTENALATQSERLNDLLGRDINTPFCVAELASVTPDDLTIENARESALRNRPELREARLKLRQADYDRRISKSEYIPDVSFTFRYLGLRSNEILPNNVAAAGLYLSWEPFDWGRKRNAISEKTKTIEQAKNGIAETEAQISVELNMRYRKWREAGSLLTASRLADESAQERLRVVSNKYKEQAVLVRDVLQSEAQAAEANYQYQQALASYWSAQADLLKAMGEE